MSSFFFFFKDLNSARQSVTSFSLFQRTTWLREALSEMCTGQLDEVEQIKRCLDVLYKDERGGNEGDGEEEREDDDERESAFEMLSELCENLDNARGLFLKRTHTFG